MKDWIRRLFAQMKPYRHAAWEVFFMRLLFAYAIYFLSLRLMLPEVFPEAWFEPGSWLRETFDLRASQHKLSGFAEAKDPVGMGLFVDLTFLSGEGVGKFVHWFALGTLLVYVVGVALPVSTLLLFLLHCAIFTLNNSKGAIHHGYQILTVTLLAQTLVLWAPVVGRALPKLKRWLPDHGKGLHIRDYFVYYSQMAIAGAYVIAGVYKVLRSHVKWVIDSPDVSVQIVKKPLAEVLRVPATRMVGHGDDLRDLDRREPQPDARHAHLPGWCSNWSRSCCWSTAPGRRSSASRSS